MKCEIEDRSEARILRVADEVLLQHGTELKPLLIEALSGADRIEIDLSGVTGADLSCLQLFCAACKSCRQSNTSLGLNPTPSAAFILAAKDAGYPRRTGCVSGGDLECLWIEEGKDG